MSGNCALRLRTGEGGGHGDAGAAPPPAQPGPIQSHPMQPAPVRPAPIQSHPMQPAPVRPAPVPREQIRPTHQRGQSR